MKSIIIKLILLLTLFSFQFNNSFAAWETNSGIKVIVTEKVPWANCSTIDKDGKPWTAPEWETQMYECTIEKWFTSVTKMLWKMILFFTYFAALAWVLFIIINWIMYSMWWFDQGMSEEAKKRIQWTLIWFVILLLSWVILNLVAPWVYK